MQLSARQKGWAFVSVLLAGYVGAQMLARNEILPISSPFIFMYMVMVHVGAFALANAFRAVIIMKKKISVFLVTKAVSGLVLLVSGWINILGYIY